MNRKGQVTIFIIVAIIIIAGVVLFFFFKDSLFKQNIPANFQPAYTNFQSCLEEYTLSGINLLESQGGYIDVPDYEPGSEYMPFSNRLEFLGVSVPFWYYVSGNNLQREQVPTKLEMERQLAEYVSENIRSCDFDSYYEQGFEILQDNPSASVKINGEKVDVSLRMDLEMNFEEENVLIRNHDLRVDSDLGKLYDSALKIYGEEQDSLFLEEYGVDVLRLYAPVDGVELQCAPIVWNAEEVFDELEEAIESNTLAIKEKGGDYDLQSKVDEYFVKDLGVDNGVGVRFINSRNWPHNFEVTPAEGAALVAEPVGTQEGLGVLGFCYVPYHHVFNMGYSVLIQTYSGEEIFQFPVAVVIQGNLPREPLDANAVEIGLPELCSYSNTDVEVSVYDNNLDYVDADIYYDCFGTKCYIGKTENGILEGEFPQCANGFIVAKSEGYESERQMYSTTQPGITDMILDKTYSLNVDLRLDGSSYNGDAIVSFIKGESSRTISYPSQKGVELSEGQYEIQVHIYKDSSLRLGETSQEKCIETPQTGLGGFFGMTREKCFEITIPSQIVSNALAGGGKQNYYILESELQGSQIIEISSTSLPTPNSIEKLQENYALFEGKHLGVEFR